MFSDPSKPIREQIFEEMKKPEYGYKQEVIELARKEIFEKNNYIFTMNLANTLAMIKTGNIILGDD
jgi:hypothetical protein